MNMRDLTTIIRKTDPTVTVTRAKVLVEAIVDGITAALVRDEEVRIAGLGSFAVAERAAGEGRNPRTGEPIKIPARKAAKFHAYQALKDALNPPAPSVPRRRIA